MAYLTTSGNVSVSQVNRYGEIYRDNFISLGFATTQPADALILSVIIFPLNEFKILNDYPNNGFAIYNTSITTNSNILGVVGGSDLSALTNRPVGASVGIAGASTNPVEIKTGRCSWQAENGFTYSLSFDFYYIWYVIAANLDARLNIDYLGRNITGGGPLV